MATADIERPVEYSYDLARQCPAAAPMLACQQGRHALSPPTPPVTLGPSYVLPPGQVERRPHPKETRA